MTLESLPDSKTLCSTLGPYDNLTLNCTASKPVNVSLDFEIFWTHNNTPIRSEIVASTSKIIDNTNYTTNILRLLNTTSNDSGVYTCRATLNIPGGPINMEKSFTLKGITSKIKYVCVCMHL